MNVSHTPGAPTIGVLALQGDFARHLRCIELAGYCGKEVRSLADLHAVDALILPGGESTTMGLLLRRFAMWESLRDFARTKPVWGTCAGMILLATEVEGNSITPLGVLNVSVARNAYGRQVFSFEDDITVRDGECEFVVKGDFIRAPKIRKVGPSVDILALCNGETVLIRQGNILASSFHSELRDDPRLTAYFIESIVFPAFRNENRSSVVMGQESARHSRKTANN